MTSTTICRNITFFVTLMMPLVTHTQMPAAIADERQFRIPGSNYEVVLGGPARRPKDVFEQPLLAAISAWLSMEFGLADILRSPDRQQLLLVDDLGAVVDSTGKQHGHPLRQVVDRRAGPTGGSLPVEIEIQVRLPGAVDLGVQRRPVRL